MSYPSIAELAEASRATKEHKDESGKIKEEVGTLRNELQKEKDALRDSLKNGETQAREIDRLQSDLDKAAQVQTAPTRLHISHISLPV